MKKNSFLVLITASILSLGACSGNNNKKSTVEPASKPGDDSSVEKDVVLNDLETPTTEIAFDEIEETCIDRKSVV